MSDIRFSQLATLTQPAVADDYIPIVDFSDKEMSGAGSNKRILFGNLASSIVDVYGKSGTGSIVLANNPTINSATIGTSATFNATSYTYGAGAASAMKTALAIASADITDATSAATASTIVRRNSSGRAAFNGVDAAEVVCSGQILTNATDASIYTSGEASPIYTTGLDSSISTAGLNSPIFTQQSNSNIYTYHASASVKSTNFAAYASTGASLKTSAGTAIATFGVSGQNFTFVSGTALTFNNTSYTYGTGAASAHRTALGLTTLATTTAGTGVATALAINVGSTGAVVTSNSSSTLTNKTLTSPTINSATFGTSATFNATAYTYGTGAASAMTTALGVPYWRESDYLRSFENNYLMITTAVRSFEFTGGNSVTESADIGASDGYIDIPDGVEYLYDAVQATSQLDWDALSPFSAGATAPAYLPASLHSITLTDSHYSTGGPFSQDKIVTLLSWMVTQEGFFKIRAGTARTIDASSSSYNYSNFYDNTFLQIYNDLIAAGWNIYLPNNNLPSSLGWDTNSYSDGANYDYHRGNGTYTYCTDPDTIYELLLGDDPVSDNYIASRIVGGCSAFPNYDETTGFFNTLKITQAGGDYYIAP